jgi:hypothetical protein
MTQGTLQKIKPLIASKMRAHLAPSNSRTAARKKRPTTMDKTKAMAKECNAFIVLSPPEL